MKKIKPGDIFFIDSQCFNYKDIEDSREFQNDDENYKYPLLFNPSLASAISINHEVIFCFKYLGNGKVKELSSNMEFNIESDLTSDVNWHSSFYSEEYHVINGKVVNRYNEDTDEYDVLSEDEYNTIFEEFVSEARCFPIHIEVKEKDIIKIDEESKRKYMMVSDEERVCLLHLFIAYANKTFKESFNDLYNSVNTKKEINSLSRKLSNFKKEN